MILDEYLVPVSCKRLAIGGIGFCATSRQIKIINSVIDRVTDRSYHFLMRAFRNGTDPILITDTLWPVFWLSCILFPCPLSFTFILIPGKHMPNTYFICPAIGNRHRSTQKKTARSLSFSSYYMSLSLRSCSWCWACSFKASFHFFLQTGRIFILILPFSRLNAVCSFKTIEACAMRWFIFVPPVSLSFLFPLLIYYWKRWKQHVIHFHFEAQKKESRRSLIFRNTIFSFGLCRVNCSHIIIRGQELFYRKTIRVTEYGIKDWV